MEQCPHFGGHLFLEYCQTLHPGAFIQYIKTLTSSPYPYGGWQAIHDYNTAITTLKTLLQKCNIPGMNQYVQQKLVGINTPGINTLLLSNSNQFKDIKFKDIKFYPWFIINNKDNVTVLYNNDSSLEIAKWNDSNITMMPPVQWLNDPNHSLNNDNILVRIGIGITVVAGIYCIIKEQHEPQGEAYGTPLQPLTILNIELPASEVVVRTAREPTELHTRQQNIEDENGYLIPNDGTEYIHESTHNNESVYVNLQGLCSEG